MSHGRRHVPVTRPADDRPALWFYLQYVAPRGPGIRVFEPHNDHPYRPGSENTEDPPGATLYECPKTPPVWKPRLSPHEAAQLVSTDSSAARCMRMGGGWVRPGEWHAVLHGSASLTHATRQPLASDKFLSKLEAKLGRRLRPLPVGRPRLIKPKKGKRANKK